MNPEDHVRMRSFFRAARTSYYFAIYEPGFMRAGAARARAAGTKAPIYRLTSCSLHRGRLSARPHALAAYLPLLEEERPGAPWMIGASAPTSAP